MDKKHILITGGFGYVGSRLTPHLLSLGYKIRTLDLFLYGDDGLQSLKNSSLNEKFIKNLDVQHGDIRNPKDVTKALEGIDTVIHLAAISNDPVGELDEIITRQTNFDALGLLLEVSKTIGIKRFINISSSSVFGIKDNEEVGEVLEPEPLTFYSKYKALGEAIVRAANSKEFCATNIRPATICGYSPRQRLDLTVNKLTTDALLKRKITVHGGEQRRPNIAMTDILNLYTQLITIPDSLIGGRTFNFGFQNLKVIEIAKLIQKELAHLDVAIEINETKDMRDYHISSSKLVKELNYKPISNIQKAIAELKDAIQTGLLKNPDDAKYYNMKSLKIERNSNAYSYFGR